MLLINGMTYDELVKKVKDMGFANVTDITSRMVSIHVSLENGKKLWEMQPLKTRDDVRALALYMGKGKDIAEYTVNHFEKTSGRFYKVSFDEVHYFLETVEEYIRTQEEESRLERKAADIILNADDLGYPMITNDYYKIKSLLRDIELKKYSCSIEINETNKIRAFGMMKGYDPSITEEVMKTLYKENKINSGMAFVTDYVTIDHDNVINKITLNKVENTFKTIKKQMEEAEAEKKLEKVNEDTTTTTDDAAEEVTDNTVTDEDTTTTTDEVVEEVTDDNNKTTDVTVTKENKEDNKMNTNKEVKINERDLIKVAETLHSLKKSPDGWRYDVCYVPETGALYTGDLHVNNQSWSQFNEDYYIQFPITKIFADTTVNQLKEFIKDVMTVVDPYNPSEDDELLIAGLMWKHLEWPGKRHFKNDVIFKVDGSRVPIGKVEFVLRYVDANKTINRLYVHEAIDGIAPELTVFTLYKRYADNTDELLQVTYDTAKALALKADLDAWRYLQVFKNEEEAKYLALKQHMDAESYLKIFKTEKPKTIDDTSVIRGYRFEFELGSVRMIWDEENRDADGKYPVDVLYKFRGDGYSWHDACTIYLDPDEEELDEDSLYEWCLGTIESGNCPLTEERRAEEEATW